MSEENIEKKKSNYAIRILKFCLRSPINVLFGCLLIYFAVKAYLFEPTVSNKILMFGTLGLWFFWFLAKQLFILILVLVLLGSGVYLYYDYSRAEINKCEDSGGYWNENTKTCEKKLSWWEKLQKTFNISVNKETK